MQYLFVACTSAPMRTSGLTLSVAPVAHASCSGVIPCAFACSRRSPSHTTRGAARYMRQRCTVLTRAYDHNKGKAEAAHLVHLCAHAAEEHEHLFPQRFLCRAQRCVPAQAERTGPKLAPRTTVKAHLP